MAHRRPPRRDRSLLWLSAGCFVAAVGLQFLPSAPPPAGAQRNFQRSQDLFIRFADTASEAYEMIVATYDDEVDPTLILQGGIEGLFSGLDQYSMYLKPEWMSAVDESPTGTCERTGLRLSRETGDLRTAGAEPDSPAERAGVPTGSRVLSIGGEDALRFSVADALDALGGTPGTTVTLEVAFVGDDQPHHFEMARAIVEVRSVFWRMEEGNIGYLRMKEFDENCSRDMRRGILNLREEGMIGLVFDLRGNPGGFVREAVEVADFFLPRGAPIATMRGRLLDSIEDYRAQSAPIVECPVFVLVDKHSASASEFVSGALQDHRAAVIFGPEGERTHGKGCAQEIHALEGTLADDPNGNPMTCGIRLTTSLYYLPTGRTIHEIGVDPDVHVPVPAAELEALRKRGLLGDVSAYEADAPVRDAVLEEALRQMRIAHILSQRPRRLRDDFMIDVIEHFHRRYDTSP